MRLGVCGSILPKDQAPESNGTQDDKIVRIVHILFSETKYIYCNFINIIYSISILRQCIGRSLS